MTCAGSRVASGKHSSRQIRFYPDYPEQRDTCTEALISSAIALHHPKVLGTSDLETVSHIVMSWRRGLLFAVIHLAIAVPLIVQQEAHELAAMRNAPPNPTRSENGADRTNKWKPTGMIFYVPSAARIVQVANLPAAMLTGWQDPNSQLYWALRAVASRHGVKRQNIQAGIAVGFTALIATQWFLLAGIASRKWPFSTVITGCAVVAVCLWALPQLTGLEGVPMLLALGTWFVWLGVAALALARHIRRIAQPLPTSHSG